MTAPHRVQRTRTRGGGMPAGAVYVGRPTRWGNPYRVGDPDPMAPGHTLTAETAVRMYAWYLESRDDLRADARRELAGRDLACWCKQDAPCHADELLRRANEPEPQTRIGGGLASRPSAPVRSNHNRSTGADAMEGW